MTASRFTMWLAAIAVMALADGPARAQSCDDAGALCRAALPASCLTRVGAGAMSSAAGGEDCDAAFRAYTECLAATVERCDSGAAPVATDGSNADAKTAFDYAMGLRSPDALDDVAASFPTTFWGRQAAKEAARLRNVGVITDADTEAKPPVERDAASCALTDLVGEYDTRYGAMRCETRLADGAPALFCCYGDVARCNKTLTLKIVGEEVRGGWLYANGRTGLARFSLRSDCRLGDGAWGSGANEPTTAWRVSPK